MPLILPQPENHQLLVHTMHTCKRGPAWHHPPPSPPRPPKNVILVKCERSQGDSMPLLAATSSDSSNLSLHAPGVLAMEACKSSIGGENPPLLFVSEYGYLASGKLQIGQIGEGGQCLHINVPYQCAPPRVQSLQSHQPCHTRKENLRGTRHA